MGYNNVNYLLHFQSILALHFNELNVIIASGRLLTAQPRLHKRKYGNVEKEEVKTLPAEQSQLEKCGIEEKFVRSFDLDKK